MVQIADRNDAVKPARTDKGSIQFPDLIRGIYQEIIALFLSEQRDLLQEFIRDGFVCSGGIVPLAGDFFKFVDKDDGFFQIPCFFK